MNRAVEIMKSNVNNKMSVTEIANKVDLSYSYFCMLFNKTFGSSPIDYFIGLKIAKARELVLICFGRIAMALSVPYLHLAAVSVSSRRELRALV